MKKYNDGSRKEVEMKGWRRKIAKRVLALILLLGFSFMGKQNVYASEESLESAKQGIVQVNLIYKDDDDKDHIILGGTGFLIGDAEEEVEYVVTSKHIIAPDKEYIKAALTAFGVPNDDLDNKVNAVQYEVVVANDVTTPATLFITSDNLDMAVLELSDPLHKKAMLTLYTSDDGKTNDLPYKETDSVYTLGFPSMISFDTNSTYYGSDQVVMSSGKIMNMHSMNDNFVITHDIAIGANNCGGPLLDEHGYVIGMTVLAKDGDYFVAVDATELIEIFDSFDMKYGKVTKSTIEGKEKEAEASQKEKEPKKEVVEKETIPVAVIVIGAVFGVIFLALLVVVILLLAKRNKSDTSEPKKKKEKKKKKEPVLEKPFDSDWSASDSTPIVSNGTGTSMLNVGQPAADETSLLQGPETEMGPVSRGKLIRKKTGENIDLIKDRTVIGKDSLHVDYCIRDNTAISRMHIIVTATSTGVCVEDAHSTNGTYVNGKRLGEGEVVQLRGGENIRLGNEEFIFRK